MGDSEMAASRTTRCSLERVSRQWVIVVVW